MYSLAAAYERSQALHRRHGRTYYLATMLLPAWKRRHVHALYGFTRFADEIVDDLSPGLGPAQRAAGLSELASQLRAGWAGGWTGDEFPGRDVLAAVLHTAAVFRLPHEDFESFLTSMAMDLEVTEYRDYQDLLGYMAGSAAVIGSMMVPVLWAHGSAVGTDAAGPVPPAVRTAARELGLAFQLTNFLRDVGEDLGRQRVYLPLADLARFGVSRADLLAARGAGVSPTRVRELIAFEVARARLHYAAAADGVRMLPRSSQWCVRAAFAMYGEILALVQRRGYEVFGQRVVVPRWRKLALVARALVAGTDGLPAVPGRELDPRRTPRAARAAAELRAGGAELPAGGQPAGSLD